MPNWHANETHILIVNMSTLISTFCFIQMASASGGDNDYRPAFLENADGQFHDSVASFFHDECTVATAKIVKTPLPPVFTLPPLPLPPIFTIRRLPPPPTTPPNYCIYNNYPSHHGSPVPFPFSQALNIAHQGYGAYSHQKFPTVQLDAKTPKIPTSAVSSSAGGKTTSTGSNPCPRRRAKEHSPRKAPKKIEKEKKTPRLHPITGHPMRAISKPRPRRKTEESQISDETRKKKKRVIPRDIEAEKDSLSRKDNQCYQNGTALVRYEDVKLPTHGHALWVVESYQLIQKYTLGSVDRNGTRRYDKTDRYLGWLADDPAIYFPLNAASCDVLDREQNVMLVRNFPSQDEVTNYYQKMEVNRPSFPTIEKKSFADKATTKTTPNESVSEDIGYDYEDDIKQEPESELEEGEIID